MDVESITLLIAVSGLALSVASLTWQVATHKLTGPRMRVEVKHGLRGPAAVISWEPHDPPSDVARHVSDGFNKPVVVVTVRNVGRMAASVDSVNFSVGKVALQPDGAIEGPAMPHRIDAHDAAAWYVDAEPISRMAFAAHEALGGADPCETLVRLTTGKTVKGSVRFDARRLGRFPTR